MKIHYGEYSLRASASYGPAFRQTRQHCRRPIIRAAANSTSVHDAAQSWRTTVNWDCLVIRVNTIGKKRYFEERSANVRSETFFPTLFFFLHIFSIVFSCHFEYIDTIKIDEWLLLILFSFSPTNLDLYGYYDVWSIDTTFFVTKIKKEKRKVKRDINGKNRERKTSEKNNRIAYPRSRYLPSRR